VVQQIALYWPEVAIREEGRAMAAIDIRVIEDTAIDAHHKLAVLQGLMRSELGRTKTAIILGLIDSLGGWCSLLGYRSSAG
jgi:hypothetical protein